MAHVLYTWAINQRGGRGGGLNLVRNLQYRLRTRLVRGSYSHSASLCLSVEISAVNIYLLGKHAS